MNKRKLLMTITAGLFLAGSGTVAQAAVGLTGDCADCHTMHNSFQGQSVAVTGTTGTATTTPIMNLLKMDCIACHVVDPNGAEKIVDLGGGSQVPQVWHADASGDLAGGNFRYIAVGGNRKGHNVVDLVAADSQQLVPPGHRHKTAPVGEGGFEVDKFTCAGYMGCHGYRSQVLTSSTIQCDEFGINEATGVPCTAEELELSGQTQYQYRIGLAALSGIDGPNTASLELKRGAHHQSYDGVKHDGLDPNFYDSPLAHSYRFIRSLRGYGNETDRWQNVNADSHNEYVGGYESTAIGDLIKNTDFSNTSTCSRCHVGGTINATSSRMTTPGQSMTGFCITCHGTFHSSGVTNGSSGAFLRHPSDYVIPDKAEYANYTSFDISAPVARPHAFFADGMTASNTVTPGTDIVMCLSCHMAHASPFDSMLRFDYASQTSKMVAGSFDTVADAQAEGGCLACHTTKGVLPENR